MKMSELKDLTLQELQDKLEDDRKAVAKLRFDHAVSPLEDPMELRRKRKDIARMLTELNMRDKANTQQA
jgi:large subunit ribosomal protein L29